MQVPLQHKVRGNYYVVLPNQRIPGFAIGSCWWFVLVIFTRPLSFLVFWCNAYALFSIRESRLVSPALVVENAKRRSVMGQLVNPLYEQLWRGND
jgi:hypothetical protein